MRNLVNILDLTTSEIDGLIDCALDIIDFPEKYADACRAALCDRKHDPQACGQEISNQNINPIS